MKTASNELAKEVLRCELATRFLRGAARIKASYKRQDELFAELRKAMSVGDTVIADGAVYELVDNYATDDVVYRVHGIRRFELKERKGKQP